MPIQDNFWHNYFTREPIFKIFVARFTTFMVQKEDMIIFFFGVSEKCDFEKCSF